MSLNSKESPTGPMTVLAEAPAAEGRDPAGQLLTQLTVLPVLLIMAWLLVGLPLLLLGWFRPAPQIALFVLVAAVLVPVTLRRAPTLAPPALQGTPGRRGQCRHAAQRHGHQHRRDQNEQRNLRRGLEPAEEEQRQAD